MSAVDRNTTKRPSALKAGCSLVPFPARPLGLTLTHVVTSLQHMAIEWGVTPLEIPESSDVDDLWRRSIETAREAGIVDAGDRVVLTAGTAVNIPGSTNVIKVDAA